MTGHAACVQVAGGGGVPHLDVVQPAPRYEIPVGRRLPSMNSISCLTQGSTAEWEQCYVGQGAFPSFHPQGSGGGDPVTGVEDTAPRDLSPLIKLV